MKDFKLKINKPELKRAFILIEDGEFNKAYSLIDDYLNHDPENAYAYLGLLLIDCRIKDIELLKKMGEPYDENENYKKVLRFGNKKIVNFVQDANSHVKYCQSQYDKADALVNQTFMVKNYYLAIRIWERIIDFKDSKDRIQKAIEEACDLANQRYSEIPKTVKQENNNIEIAKLLYDLEYNSGWLQKEIDSYNKTHLERKNLDYSGLEIFNLYILYKQYLPEDYSLEYLNLQEYHRNKEKREKRKKKILIVLDLILVASLAFVLINWYFYLRINDTIIGILSALMLIVFFARHIYKSL